MKGRVLRRPLFSCTDRFRSFLESVAAELAEVEGVSVRDGDHPGGMPWLRIATSTGQVDVWDGAEVGERGVFIQACEIPDADEDWPASIGDQTRVCDGGGVAETAQLIRSYGGPIRGRTPTAAGHAGPARPGATGRRGEVAAQAAAAAPGLPRRLPDRPGSGHVTPATFPGLPGHPPTGCPPRTVAPGRRGGSARERRP